MPRQSTVSTSWEARGRKIERKYRITFTDDSDERAEAIRFFGEALFPALYIPECTYQMSEEAAQDYLDIHPMQEQWRMLTLHRSRITFENDDLYRLQYFPELEGLHSHADHLTDAGVSHIRRIPGLRRLLIYSPLVTDACLADIAALRYLRTLDLQGSHRVTREAFDALATRLPQLVDVYPPFHSAS